MTASILDIMRQHALSRRVKGIAGGNRIAWAPKDIARIHDHIKSLPEKIIRAARRPCVRSRGAKSND
jgi:hypothetical protein